MMQSPFDMAVLRCGLEGATQLRNNGEEEKSVRRHESVLRHSVCVCTDWCVSLPNPPR